MTECDVSRAIGDFVAGRLSLDELDDWLTRQTWDNPCASALALRAELLIAEADRGHRPGLADDLRRLANEPQPG